MKTIELVDLMLKSSDNNPYTGKLSVPENIFAAIELAKLCKQFSQTGMEEEAMNIPTSQWEDVIDVLKWYQIKHLVK